MDVWPLPRLSFRELTSIQESRPAALITQPSAWANVSQSVKLPLLIQAEPNRNARDFFDYLASNLPAPVQVIYAVGDTPVIDAAKIVSQRNNKPLVIVLTAISSDAAFTPTSNVYDNGQLSEVTTGPADEVIIDLNLIKQAPPEQRAAGIVDVLSIVTGMLDWTYATQKNQLPPEAKVVPWATSIAASVAAQAIKSASAMGRGDSDALRTLVDLLAVTVQLDNQLGHRRASQGVEHIFADAVKADSPTSHAERVGPGILLASALHGKDSVALRAAMTAAGVRLNQLKHEDIRAIFNTLPDYARQRHAPYTILNDLQANSDELAQAMNKSTLFTSA